MYRSVHERGLVVREPVIVGINDEHGEDAGEEVAHEEEKEEREEAACVQERCVCERGSEAAKELLGWRE
jgi:hypothetical protein